MNSLHHHVLSSLYVQKLQASPIFHKCGHQSSRAGPISIRYNIDNILKYMYIPEVG